MLLMYIRVPTELGVGGDIVMKLTESLEKGKHLKMFADNYFTSIKLAIALKERSMFYVGTVQATNTVQEMVHVYFLAYDHDKCCKQLAVVQKAL